MERSFTVEKTAIKDGEGGRFIGKIPSQAARKAGRSLLKMSPKKKQVRFTLRETTQGSEKKEYTYIATKTKLDKPKVIKRGDIEITVKHEYLVKACM